MKKLLALLLCLGMVNANSAEWICYKSPVSRFDIIDIYSGRPVYRDGSFVTGCMMGVGHLATQDAFGQLGLNPEVPALLAKKYGIVQHKLKVVGTEEEMVGCVKQNQPAVGYVFVNQDKYIVQCFKP
jgi:hypothetical protein